MPLYEWKAKGNARMDLHVALNQPGSSAKRKERRPCEKRLPMKMQEGERCETDGRRARRGAQSRGKGRWGGGGR